MKSGHLNTLFLVIFLCLTVNSYGQTDQIQINPYEIGEKVSFVFNNDNPASQKHLNAKGWIAKTFGDYKSVIQFEDDTNYKLILKGHSDLPNEVISISALLTKMNVYYTLEYTITIDSREERYRLVFDDVRVHSKTETYVLGSRESDIDKEKDRLVKEYCRPFSPAYYNWREEKYSREIDSLSFVLTSLPEKKSRAIEKQKKELQTQIQEQKEMRARVVSEREQAEDENTRRYEAIYNTFYNMVSTFKSAVEEADDF